MEKFIIGLIVLTLLSLGTIQFTSLFKYLGLDKLEAVALSFLITTFLLASIAKIMVSYLGFHPLFF
ncbi:hypothetical protein [Flammeovirga sp. SJP92]|uniref:hypothetical protein n=1 Tax=Flammeovirga sp. SJP92 TaxID=1775430 RepID=UPI000788DA1D|nr:hypothetical protein [Flammeovirga sp. SJP92]KXX72315.1 hypothetical protein AVL50_01555 [Flammeovirga sp. SJP92]